MLKKERIGCDATKDFDMQMTPYKNFTTLRALDEKEGGDVLSLHESRTFRKKNSKPVAAENDYAISNTNRTVEHHFTIFDGMNVSAIKNDSLVTHGSHGLC